MPSFDFTKGTSTHLPWKVAHRGCHNIHVENTLEAFREAYDLGCDMVEFDVQLSKDGVPFIFHDDEGKRLAGIPDLIYEMNWKEIKALRMPSPLNKKGNTIEYQIPSLEDFLREFSHRAFYLELKVPKAKLKQSKYFNRLGELSAQMVRDSKPNPSTFLSSFHGDILTNIFKKKSYPRLAGIFENEDYFYDVFNGENVEIHKAIQYYSVSWDIFKKILKNAEKLTSSNWANKFLIWDIKGANAFQKAARCGVAGIVTDDIANLIQLHKTHNSDH